MNFIRFFAQLNGKVSEEGKATAQRLPGIHAGNFPGRSRDALNSHNNELWLYGL